MILFLKNIPPDTRPNELKSFVEASLNRFLFFRSGKIIRAEILIIQDLDSDEREYHGLVEVDSEWAGRRAINKLKRQPFRNRLVKIREYVNRDWHNDPRSFQNKPSKDLLDKRLRDRRRGNSLKIINDFSTVFSSANYNVPRKMN